MLKSLKLKNTPAIFFILSTVMIDFMSIGIIIPIMPKLMQELTEKSLNEISLYNGWLIFIFSICQFIFSPILGALSDKFGRKSVLVLSLLGMSFNYWILFFSTNLLWLFIGRILSGIMGATISTASAYIADISSDKTRARNFGLFQAAFGVGFMLGPFIGGVLGDIDIRLPFFVSAIVSLLNAIYGMFIPESLTQKNKTTFSFKTLNPLNSIFYFFKKSYLALIMLSYFLFYLGLSVFESIWTLFLIEKFNWTIALIGYSLGLFGLSALIAQSFLAPYIIKRFGYKKSVIVGMSLTIVCYVMISSFKSGWIIIAIAPIFEIGWIGMTAFIASAVTKVGSQEQGRFQGVLAALVSIANFTGPLIMTFLFYKFSKKDSEIYFPGAPFILSAFLASLGLGFFIYQWIIENKKQNSPSDFKS